jgi:GT2 family glycosyltransferase
MTSGTWLVVLNWNGRDDTLELLTSLEREPATVLVVDNGSADGTLRAVQAQFPRVRTLQTGANLGYAGGNNAGIDYALAEGADVVGVLNNDTVVEPGFLEPLLATLSRSGSAAVSPDIRYADRPDVSWFRGSHIDGHTGWPQHVNPARQLPADTAEIATPVLTGCCIVATGDVWRRVGNFDDGMFLMFEDSDWSRRAIDRGVRLLVVPRSRIRHKVSRSFTGQSGVLGAYYFARNGTVFAQRHLGLAPTLRFLVRQVFRPSVRQLLDAERRPAAVMSYLGVLAALARRRGAAGRMAAGYARRAIAQRDAGRG